MKPNEIIFRQNRVVYVLMVLLAIVGMVWGFREHQRQTAGPALPAAHSAPTAAVPMR